LYTDQSLDRIERFGTIRKEYKKFNNEFEL
jgi:hypothetical protein